MLHPLKFKPRFKERIWGGRALEKVLDKKLPDDKKIGESWEISGLQGDLSVVSDGELKGNNIQELIEVYMGDLVGEKVYEKYGIEFPLLIKFIDAQDDLSIQVHPDDELAEERHHSYGKTEMWYIMSAEPGASIYLGFNRSVTPEEYLDAIQKGKLESLLNKVEVKAGDSFFIPAGTIHAIGKGTLIAEIQQASDVTYRVYDWNRVDAEGNSRKLHTELSVAAIDFRKSHSLEDTAVPIVNEPVMLEECDYFTVNLLQVDDSVERDYSSIDSFVIYVCIDGEMTVCYAAGCSKIKKGETILLPAQDDNIEIDGEGKLLEVYIK